MSSCQALELPPRRIKELQNHFHGTMRDKDGVVFGGHIVKGQCSVLTMGRRGSDPGGVAGDDPQV